MITEGCLLLVCAHYLLLVHLAGSCIRGHLKHLCGEMWKGEVLSGHSHEISKVPPFNPSRIRGEIPALWVRYVHLPSAVGASTASLS